MPCDDGDDCTTADVFDADCNCAGVFSDTDVMESVILMMSALGLMITSTQTVMAFLMDVITVTQISLEPHVMMVIRVRL